MCLGVFIDTLLMVDGKKGGSRRGEGKRRRRGREKGKKKGERIYLRYGVW